MRINEWSCAESGTGRYQTTLRHGALFLCVPGILWRCQWRFGTKAHIGVKAKTGLVHRVVATATNPADGTQGPICCKAEDKRVFGDAGYTGADTDADTGTDSASPRSAARCS